MSYASEITAAALEAQTVLGDVTNTDGSFSYSRDAAVTYSGTWGSPMLNTEAMTARERHRVEISLRATRAQFSVAPVARVPSAPSPGQSYTVTRTRDGVLWNIIEVLTDDPYHYVFLLRRTA